MPRRNKRDKRQDPRELRILGDPSPDEIEYHVKPMRRRDKWKYKSEPVVELEDDDDPND